MSGTRKAEPPMDWTNEMWRQAEKVRQVEKQLADAVELRDVCIITGLINGYSTYRIAELAGLSQPRIMQIKRTIWKPAG